MSGPFVAPGSDGRPGGAPATTGDPEAGASASLSRLGVRLRQIRKGRKLSLVKLSKAAGVSVAMLSHIELGKATPSLKVLDRLRSALGVSMVDLFPEGEAAGSFPFRPVLRAAERISLEFPEIGLTKQRLSPGEKSDLELLLLLITPGGGSGPEPWTRVGEKAGMVLTGEARLEIDGTAYELSAGDSFQFDSRQPHRFEALGDAAVEILWIIKSDPLARAVDA